MAEVSGGWERGRPRLGWTHSGKVALGTDGGDCASMHERSERVESPGTFVTE